MLNISIEPITTENVCVDECDTDTKILVDDLYCTLSANEGNYVKVTDSEGNTKYYTYK